MSKVFNKKSVLAVREFLHKFATEIEIIELKSSARTAKDASISLNTEVGAIVKSIVLKDRNNEFYLCLCSGDKYISIEKASISINGVSLTISKVTRNSFQITIIPHTLRLTNLIKLKRGDKVITVGGIVGTIDRIIDAEKVEVEIADNVKVEIIKSTGIQSLVTANQETKK